MKFKYQYIFSILLLIAIVFVPIHQYAQCPQIEAIMVDACGTEQINEFVLIHSGSGFNIDNLQLDFDSNNNFNNENHDINKGANPCGWATGNIAAYTGCSNLIAIGPGFDVPANAIVVLQASSGSANNLYNFSALCGSGQCVYVVANSCTRSVGAFTNGGVGIRTNILSLDDGSCTETVTYDRALLTGGNGAYIIPPSTYGNGGCVSPPIAPAQNPFTPTFDPQGPYCQGENFTLPGTSNNGINGSWAPAINNQQTTIYTFTPTAGQCANTAQMTVTINPAVIPTFTQLGPYCQGENFTLPGTSNNGINGSWAPAINNQQTTIYTFTPTAGQCANTAQMTVTINPAITPTFTQLGPYCQGENFTLPGTSNNGINGSWAPAVNNQQTTIYTFTPTAGQCANTAQMTVTINPAVTPTFTQLGPYCQGESFTLPSTSNNGINGSWAPAVNNQQTTTYTFTPTVGQCASTTQMTVTINPTITPTFTQLGPYCQGENFTLPGTSNNGINGSWAPAINNQQTTTYTFTPTAGQCANTAQMTVTINPTITPTFTQLGPYCQGENFTLPGTSNNGINGSWAPAVNNQQTTTYTFTPTTGQCANTAEMTVTINTLITPTFTQLGPYCQSENFTLPGTSNNGINGSWAPAVNNQQTTMYTFTPTVGQCANTAEMTVTINLPTTPIFTQIGPYCQGENFTLPGTSNNGIDGSWTPAVNNQQTTTYTFTPIAGQCANTAQMTVTINPPVAPTFTQLGPYCQGENFTLPGTSNNGINGSWAPAVNNQQTTIYTFTPTAGQCANTAQMTVTINPPITPTFTQLGPYCQGENFTLPGTSNNGINGLWAPAFNNQQTTTYTFTPTAGQCANTAEMTVAINPPTTPTFTQLGPYCQGENFTLPGTSNNGINGSWAPAINNQQTTTYTFTPTAGQCANTAQTTVTINPPVAPTFTQLGPYCQGENFTLPGTSNNGINGSWSPAVNNQQTTTYTFTPTAGQCANTAQMTVVVQGMILNCIVLQDESTPGADDGIAQINISGGYPNYLINLSGPLNQTLSNQLPGTHLFDNLPPGAYSIQITDSNGCTTTCNFVINPSGCQLSIVVDDFANISCFGGQNGFILLMATGQNGVVDYEWSGPVGIGNTNFANNLPAGVYTVTATDESNCISTVSISLTQPQDIQQTCEVIAFESSPGANDGIVSITLAGGVFPGEIEILGPINITEPVTQEGTIDIQNLVAGIYDVIYTDFNGCQVFCQFEIESCATIVTITQINDIACHGESTASITAFVNGQNGNLSIQWNQGLPPWMSHDNLSAGVYEITVSDEFGCNDSDQITITEPAALSLICSSTPEQNGNDGIIHLQIQGGVGFYFIECTGPLNQNFNNVPPGNFDITQLPPGMYSVLVTDENGCEISCSTTVQSMGCMIDLTLTIQSEISCFGDFDAALLAEVNNATGTITYNWNGPVSIPNNEPNPQNLPAGSYFLTVTDEDGCTATAAMIILSPPGLSLSGTSLPESFPGANDGSFTLTINGGTPLFLMTYSGPQSGSVDDLDEGDITIDQLPPGTYQIIVTDANGCTESLEIVVRPASCNLELTLTVQQNISCFGANDGVLLAEVINFSGQLLYDWFGPVSIPDSESNPQNLSPGTYMLTVVDEEGCTATANITLQEPLELEFRCSSIPVSAQGMSDGSLIINLTGGTVNYIIQYSGPVNGSEVFNTPGVFPIAGLPVGNYSILVTDANGCTATCETVISNSACSLFLLGSFTPPTCHGGNNGRIRIIPNGAVGNVSYTWVGPFDPGDVDDSNMLPAGFYIISGVDEAFCTDTFRITLTEPDPIILNCIVDEHESTSGEMDGQISFSWVNGNGPFRYTVNGPAGSSESITNNRTATVNQLGAGNYTILVTDARGCTATCELIILSGDCTISVSLQQESEINCFGGNEGSIRAMVLNASGTITYQWNPAQGNSPLIPNLAAGVYELTVEDSDGCTANTSITITEPSLISLQCSASPSSGPASSDGALIFNISGGIEPYLIEWNGPQNGSEIDNAGTTTISGVLPGNYSILITDANGCTSTCNVVAPSSPCNLNLNCQVTGHPTEGESDGQVIINWNSPLLLEARLILPDGSEIIENLSNSWFIQDLSPGIHIIIIRSPNGCIDTCQLELISTPCQIEVSELVQELKCNDSNDGSINITVTNSGGNPQILWNDGSVLFNRSDLSAGNWTYTITDDADCSFESEIVLQNPELMIIQGLEVLAGNCVTPLSSIYIEDILHAKLPLVLFLGSTRYDVLSFPFLSSPTAAGIYTINITDSNGCTIETEVSLISFTPLRLAPMVDLLVRPGESIFQQLVLIGEAGDLEFGEILFNGQLICQNCLDFSFIAVTDGQFTARIRDIFGCEHIITWNLRVELDQDVFIPGIFTPNRDGINDVFRVFGNDNIAMIDEFEIFNRWGDKVFSAYNVESEELVGWDGTFNGMHLNPAVFIYKVLITFRDGRSKLFAGEVVLAE